MTNKEGSEARRYHRETNLTYINLGNKPPLFKLYRGAPQIPLPGDFPKSEVPVLEANASTQAKGQGQVTLDTLAQVLFLTAGLKKKGKASVSGEVHYRAASSAGALYPIEVYLVTGGVPGLSAGVYHFSPSTFALHRLREGDFRSQLSEAASHDPEVASSAATLIFTSVFWRSSWKYKARSYRYCLWDNGTMVANLLATASSGSVTARVIAGFADGEVNRLLGLPESREAAFCLVPLGGATASVNAGELGPLAGQVEGLDYKEIEYPEIHRLHQASSLKNSGDVEAWRGELPREEQEVRGRLYPLENHGGASASLWDAISGRTSARRFSREPIALSQLSAILDKVAGDLEADFLGQMGSSLLDIYVVTNAVQSIPPGAYHFSPTRKALELLREGDFRDDAGFLCFEQALAADASAVVFFLADLDSILDRFGDRGYRAAQLEAGIRGGRVYLGAEALGLGATGITFYDDDVTDFFSPHARGKAAIFAVPLGMRHRSNRVIPFRSRRAIRIDASARGAGMGA
jgi:SagB-type dehydrogenase family enzyme